MAGDATAARAPLFLVGCPRSGTTLLQRLLDAHSQIAIAPETHFIRRFWLKRDDYGDLRDDAAANRLVADIVAMPEFAEMHLDAAAFAAAARRGQRSYSAFFALLLRSFAEQRNRTLVGEKTPNHLLYMRRLESFFPGARFIHIIRDPRAVVASWRSVPWSTGTLAGDTAVWRRYIQMSWKQPPRPGALHVVRYEALASAPERELEAICTFLGVEDEPRMLAFHEQESDTLNFTREPWKKGAAAPVNTSAVEEWRQTLTAREIAAIEELAWPEMMRLGYRPVSSAASLVVGAGKRAWRRLTRRGARSIAAR